MDKISYLSLNQYYRGKYNRRVQRITLSLDFTCPNIDGTKGTGGCAYCHDGSIPAGRSREAPVEEQLKRGIEAGKKRYGDGVLFTAYFQANSNTYAGTDELKKLYSAPLAFKEIIGISIGTRPDCVGDEVLELIGSFKEKYREIWLEFGLQSSNDRTLKRINRGHSAGDFADAVKRAKAKGIKTAAHIIIGFPWETPADYINTARFAALAGVDGVKIHPFHIIRGTRLAAEHEKEGFRLLPLEEYVSALKGIIGVFPEGTVIMRFTAEAPPGMLIAPDYCTPEYKNVIKEMVSE